MIRNVWSGNLSVALQRVQNNYIFFFFRYKVPYQKNRTSLIAKKGYSSQLVNKGSMAVNLCNIEVSMETGLI